VTAVAARVGSRLTRTLRSPEVTASRGAARIRILLAGVFAAYALFLTVATVADGRIPAWPQVIMLMMAGALLSGRGGSFVRDWAPVVLGVLAYTQGALLVERLHLGVHYLPQIEADRIIGLGQVPTQWLQAHLYGGHTGVLEIVALLAYASHFFVPLGVAFYVWWSRGRQVFNTLVLGLLVVSVLAEITFVLAPTAPPWLAAHNGHLAGVHPILKQALASLHLDSAASLKGDPDAYNIVAAVPSLHVALPVVGLLAILSFRLPRWLLVVQATQLAAVFFAIVYTGEHYVVDALAGALYACAAWAIVRRSLRTSEEVELLESAGGASRAPGAIRRPRRLRTTALADEGQALFEYAAIVSLVSVVAVGVLTAIGAIVNLDLSQIAGAL
jgi:Flp pilus assembly pilin Flp